jgi:Ribonuclease G/E
MALRRIAVSRRGDLVRAALLEGDHLAEFTLWDLNAPDGVGDIHTGRVTAKLPAMAGAFVDIGNQAGFLPDSAGGAKLTEGAYVAVRVTRAAQGGKGPRLAVVEVERGDKPGLIRRGEGPLLELCARCETAPVFVDDYALMADLRAGLAGRLLYQGQTFDAVLEDEVAELFLPSADLGRGAKMHVAATAALTAIDIDAGGASAEQTAKPAAQLGFNVRVIPKIARQILLRNLSGAILIDFAGMKPAVRERLTEPLVKSLKADYLRPKFFGFSKLGFAEISRPRIRPPLHEMITL